MANKSSRQTDTNWNYVYKLKRTLLSIIFGAQHSAIGKQGIKMVSKRYDIKYFAKYCAQAHFCLAYKVCWNYYKAFSFQSI